ncbi:MAG: OmpH family outer membrane protein [Blastocatellia bacterium]|nr:OmpH family outer membrane protein [Blastocatellia bacterium]
MKKMIFASLISSLVGIFVMAQTPAPPKRPPAAAKTTPAEGGESGGGGTGAEGKVAVLFSGKFRQGILELKVKLDALNTELDPKRKEIQTADDELTKLKNKIQTQGTTVSPQVRDGWVDEATEKEKTLKRQAEDFEAFAQKRYGEVSGPIYEKIQKAIDAYSQSHGIVLVLEGGQAIQAGVMHWYSPATDITDDFMKEYNKSNPAPVTTSGK